MQEPAVEVEHLSKVYRVYRSPWDRLLEALLRRPRHRAFSALHDVSFSLERGQGLAILGENGAGKSTLLKILAGIGTPTAGRLQVRGKIASILELGSGFHPEFTGRQNIVLNAAMLGLGERELQQKLPTIVEWSELGDFIDQPVKVYSTGMAMRLGFSIATQVEPDVLIIDEALSVGDGYFQKKCMDRLLQFVGAGGTLLFCSHAMYYASAFCQRALWLRNGRVEALGAVTDVVREYENFLLHKSARGAGNDPANPADAGDPAAAGRLAVVTAGSRAATAGAPIGTVAAGSPPPAQGAADKKADDADLDAVRRPARIAEVRILGGGSPPAGDAEVLEPGGRVQPRCYLPGDPWELEIDWEAASPQFAFHVGVGINRSDDLEVLTLATHLDGRPPLSGATRYALRVALPHLPLVKGDFTLYVFLLDESGLHIYDQRIYRRAFSVQPPSYAFGLIVAEHSWSQQAQAGSQATAAGEVAGACRR